MESLIETVLICMCAFVGLFLGGFFGLKNHQSKHKLVAQARAVAYDREKELVKVSLEEQARSKLFGAAHSYYLIQQNIRLLMDRKGINKCCRNRLQGIYDQLEKALSVENKDDDSKIQT
jgi:hypothetical protein